MCAEATGKLAPTVALIRAEMERRGLTAGKLARLVDRDPSHLYRTIVTAERPLSAALAQRIVQALTPRAR